VVDELVTTGYNGVMFIRAKKVYKRTKSGTKAYTYYDLVKSYRQGDKVRVKFIKHLGKKPIITVKLMKELAKHPEISKEDLKKLKSKCSN